jgi:hypothetical protein
VDLPAQAGRRVSDLTARGFPLHAARTPYHLVLWHHRNSQRGRQVRPKRRGASSAPINCGAECHSRGHKLCSHLVVSQHFMESEGSLLSSQELSTCICPIHN